MVLRSKLAEYTSPGAMVKLAVASAAMLYATPVGSGGTFCRTFLAEFLDREAGTATGVHGGASLGHGTRHPASVDYATLDLPTGVNPPALNVGGIFGTIPCVRWPTL